MLYLVSLVGVTYERYLSQPNHYIQLLLIDGVLLLLHQNFKIHGLKNNNGFNFQLCHKSLLFKNFATKIFDEALVLTAVACH